jgi:DNA-binding CsgD family transcriptional regulator/pimeloyl-ACP methyl ester carboxylesterase
MSQRGLSDDFSVQDDVRDLEAVVDRLGLERFVLHGIEVFSHTCVRYALAHPERVEALILHVPTATAPDWTWLNTIAAQNWEYFLEVMTGMPWTANAEPERRRRALERIRQTTTQADFLIRQRAWANSNAEADLARLRAPTLVLYPRDRNSVVRQEDSTKVAALIPNARLVLIDGASGMGDANQGLKAIDDFLASLSPGEPQPAVPAGASPGSLSPREIEVLRLLAAGKSNQQIADELVISLFTVNRHVSNIYAKTGVANRAEAGAFANRHGLV